MVLGKRMLLACVPAVAALVMSATPVAAAKPAPSIPPEAQIASTGIVTLDVVPISPTVMAANLSKGGASSLQVMAVAGAVDCWSGHHWAYAKNSLGGILYEYHELHDWCGNGTYITYTNVFTWGANTNWGWGYQGDSKNSSYGLGWPKWNETMSGHFCIRGPWGCLINGSPWLNFSVGAGGQTYYQSGGN